jgi:hypothetical protein
VVQALAANNSRSTQYTLSGFDVPFLNNVMQDIKALLAGRD